jgi:hypothetical protein
METDQMPKKTPKQKSPDKLAPADGKPAVELNEEQLAKATGGVVPAAW